MTKEEISEIVRRRHELIRNEPSIAEMAANFTGEMLKWAAAGFKTVGKTIYDYRMSVCAGTGNNDGCEYWDGKTRLGYGKCNAPGCGCGRGKQWISTSRCPLNRWEDGSSPKLP